MIELFKNAGWYVIPTMALGIFSLILIGIAACTAVKHKKNSSFLIDSILFLGCLSLAYALLEQMSGFFHAADALQQTDGAISPSLAWLSLKISFINPMIGLVVLIYSSIGWFLLKPHK
jgi:hypothetical protein